MKWTFRVNFSSYKVSPNSLSHNIAGKGYIREFLIVFLISFLSFSRFERAESQVERFRKFWGGGSIGSEGGGRSRSTYFDLFSRKLVTWPKLASSHLLHLSNCLLYTSDAADD